jgi:ketosteroid isomerase-like protein
MADEEAVLAANQAFYDAFGSGDAAAMDALWARHAPVACTHPGWTAMTDRARIIESWSAILEGASGQVSCLEPQAHIVGDVAFVTCNEAVGDNLLAATNLFVREGGAWCVVHHHASPVARAFVKGGPRRGDAVH